ncbi:MAG: 3',5'-cyclic-AMP phosphodiesterase, partial [Gammaproteobacteria bacterium]|nr:3',5'-cyclic-AMP phosphodiesterase [Gammaproteobacteria bacterium]
GSLSIVQVTDSHLYADPEGKLVGVNTQESFNQTIQLIQDIISPVDFILATGDLVHDASVDGYTRMKTQLEQFGVPVYCIPGNHDIPDVMRQCLNHGPISKPQYVQHNNWHLTFLDSTLPDHEGGHLNPEELEAFEYNLTQAEERNILICMHHHPVPIGSRWMDGIMLDNAEDFFSIIER